MDNPYDVHSWSKHYREEALREAGRRQLIEQVRADDQQKLVRGTARWVTAVVLSAVIVALAGAKPAEAAFPEEALPGGHNPIAFEKDGDIWVASKMHLANLTPDTAAYNDMGPAVSPDGRTIAFASDRDGDFEIYVANTFTGEVVRVTDNATDDRKPAWSPDGQTVTYEPSVS